MSFNLQEKDISLVILAGGKSTRMGKSLFKPLIKLKEKPLIRYVINNLKSMSDEILVIVKNDTQKNFIQSILYEDNAKIIIDSFDFSSPLAGILTAALNTEKKIILPVGTDQIFLSVDVIKKLFSYLDLSLDAVVPRWPNGYIEPLGALYKTEAVCRLIKYTDYPRELSLHGFLKKINVKYVDIFAISQAPEVSYFNINTRNDLIEAEKILSTLLP